MSDEVTTTTAEVESTLAHFVRVFNDLDWDAFFDCFADDVSVYAPFPDQPRMVVGKAALEQGWRPVFDQWRSESTGPPYVNIDPKDTQLQPLGDNVCLVSFHLVGLRGSTRLHRRTVVLEKRESRWLIVHLHASVASEAM